MSSEYYGVASTPMDDFLAHYGVKGMKWGVRKAIQTGNTAKLSKQFAKAEKKLAKLEKKAANTSKYGKRAAVLGTGAAVAGGLAAAGTMGVGRLVSGAGTVMQEAGYGASRLAGRYIKNNKIRNAVSAAGKAVGSAGTAVKGTQTSISKWGNTEHDAGGAIQRGLKNLGMSDSHPISEVASKSGIGTVSNNTLARIGAGAVGAGLGVAAARNAYRAATAKKKAENFRNQMKTSFAGTQYANRISSGSSSTASATSTKSKKRKRS